MKTRRSAAGNGGPGAQIGVTTAELDQRVHAYIVEHGAYPSPLNYRGFPKSCCTSVNNVICHGIPDRWPGRFWRRRSVARNRATHVRSSCLPSGARGASRSLRDGDLVNVDVTVFLDGVHGDSSRTFLVGNVDAAGRALVAATHEALQRAIAVCGPAIPLNRIGDVIRCAAPHDRAAAPGWEQARRARELTGRRNTHAPSRRAHSATTPTRSAMTSGWCAAR